MTRFRRRCQRWTLWGFVALMPVGVQLDPEDPDRLTLSAHGGGGRVLSVLRSCGSPIDEEANRFEDVTLGIEYARFRDDGESWVAYGLRGGLLHSWPYGPAPLNHREFRREYRYSYLNPYFSQENRRGGFGFGVILGNVSVSPYHDEHRDRKWPYSFHVRLGTVTGGHFLVSMNENHPLASGGGYFNLGLGYPLGKRLRAFTGLSVKFFEGNGWTQQLRVALDERWELDLAARYGEVEGKPETGFSAGLRLHVPLADR